MKLEDHPTVRRLRGRGEPPCETTPQVLDAAWLRQLCLDAGAADLGFVELERPDLDSERADILAALPGTRSLIAFVCRMNRDSVRSPARSVANLEFHQTTDEVDEVARRIVRQLAERGVRAVNPSAGFPQEMARFPGKIWVVSHKKVAVAAGLGQMGIHRNVIHPRFGNFILLGTVLIDAAVSAHAAPIDYDPCLECKLCVAACPVGAIGADYRSRVSDAESVSRWQSLAFGPNYKAAYCLAVCPAGEDVIGAYLASRQQHLDRVVRPLQQKQETVYAIPESPAEAHAAKRFPHKRIQRVDNGLGPPRKLDAPKD